MVSLDFVILKEQPCCPAGTVLVEVVSVVELVVLMTEPVDPVTAKVEFGRTTNKNNGKIVKSRNKIFLIILS